MSLESFKPKVGQVVLAQGRTGTHKVLAVSQNGRLATIQAFSLSKQLLLGPSIKNVPSSTLSPFRKDASPAAVRVAREAAEDH